MEFYIACGVLALILIVGGYYWWRSRKKKKASQKSGSRRNDALVSGAYTDSEAGDNHSQPDVNYQDLGRNDAAKGRRPGSHGQHDSKENHASRPGMISHPPPFYSLIHSCNTGTDSKAPSTVGGTPRDSLDTSHVVKIMLDGDRTAFTTQFKDSITRMVSGGDDEKTIASTDTDIVQTTAAGQEKDTGNLLMKKRSAPSM